MSNRAFGAPLTEEQRARIKRLVDRVGETEAARRLGLPRQTLARALAGLGLRRGTAVLFIQQLDALDAQRAA
jgi:DNA invertase Pin-like site-specific DNA recombinase